MAWAAQLHENKLLRLLVLFRRDLASETGRLSAAALVLLLQVVTELLVPWPLKVVVDNVIRHKPLEGVGARLLGPFAANRDLLLWGMLASIVLIAAANAALEYKVQAMLVRIAHRVLLTIRQRVYGHLQRLSFAFHTKQKVGDLTARVTTDINALQDLFVQGFKNLVANGLLLAGMLVVMLAIDWSFTLAALAVLPALGWLVVRYKPRVKRAARAAKRKEREMASLAQETLLSYRVVQAFSAEEFEDRRFAAHGAEAMAARVQAGTLQARFAPSVDVTLALGTALVVGLGAQRALAGEMSLGTLLVLLSYLKSMYSPMKQLAKGFGQLTGAAVSSELLCELLETDARVEERPGARPAPRFRGELVFEQVSFSYLPGRPALREIDLRLQPGQRCVVVGATGAGKSTLASLVPRFVDPDRGSVRIDGHDVRDLTLKSLRAQIAIVLQEAMLFRMSVRDNIAYALDGATDEQVLAAALAANAHEFIARLPQGYETILDERGGNLSGGQRQRLTLARAFLRNAPILILDEPTTGLDVVSEGLVLDALERLSRGRTTLTIAHRLATIERADLVVVLDDGRIVDSGTHAELAARSPRYRALCKQQLGDEQAQAPLSALEPPLQAS